MDTGEEARRMADEERSAVVVRLICLTNYGHGLFHFSTEILHQICEILERAEELEEERAEEGQMALRLVRFPDNEAG